MAREGSIKLSEAPAHFFADDWVQLASLKGGDARALAALDNPDDPFVVLGRRQRLESNRETSASRAALVVGEKADALVHRLLDGFRARGSEGRLVATGLFTGTGLRQEIDSELWATAKLKFVAGSMVADGLEYRYVTLEHAATAADAETVVRVITEWLDRRRAVRGDELKKALQDAAREEFGNAATVETFNAAYKACYKRTLGRPRKRK